MIFIFTQRDTSLVKHLVSATDRCVELEKETLTPSNVFTWLISQNKFTNCSQFLSHDFLASIFIITLFFLLVGIGQLDNDV